MAVLAGAATRVAPALGLQPQGVGHQLFDNSRDASQNDQGSVILEGTGTSIFLSVFATGLTVRARWWRNVSGTMTLLGTSAQFGPLTATSGADWVEAITGISWAVQVGDWISIDTGGTGRIGLLAQVNNSIRWTGGPNIETTDFPFANLDADLDFPIAYQLEGIPTSSDSISVTNNLQSFYQRVVSTNNRAIPFSGTYSGTPTSIRRRVRYSDGAQEDVLPWAVFDSSPSNETWTLNLTITAQNRPMVLEVDFSNDDTIIGTSSVFRIGTAIINAGESIAENMRTDTGPTAANSGCLRITPSTSNVVALAGEGDTLLANTLNNNSNVMTAVANTGIGGSKLLQGNGSPFLYPGPAPAVTTQWTNIIDTYNAIGDIEALVLNIGANDAFFALVSKADVITGYAEFFARLRAETRSDLKIIMTIAGRHLDPSIAGEQEWMDNVQAQIEAANNDANVHYTTFFDQTLSDFVHPIVAGQGETGVRLANGIITEVQGGNAPYRPPVVASVHQSDNDLVFTLTRPEGTDITPSTGITEVTAFNGTAYVAATSVVRTSANVFTATMPAGTYTDARYNWGADFPIVNIVKDNSARTLPVMQFEGTVSSAPPTTTIPLFNRRHNRRLAEFLRTEGYSGDTHAVIMSWLTDQGIGPGSLNDRFFAYLASLGCPGSYVDKRDAWSLGKCDPIAPPVPSNWILADGTWNDGGIWIDTETWNDTDPGP